MLNERRKPATQPKDTWLDKSLKFISKYPENLLHRSPPYSGVYFGTTRIVGRKYTVAKSLEDDGHISVFGGSGSGKSSCMVKRTLAYCKDSFLAIDINGELYDYWKEIATPDRKPVKVLNLTDDEGDFSTIDPFHLLKTAGGNVVQYCRELVQCLLPLPANVKEPFWIESAQCILTGIILHYFSEDYGFNETMEFIMGIPLHELIEGIHNGENETAKMLVAQFKDIEDLSNNKMLLSISTTITSRLIAFATGPAVKTIFEPSENTLQWSDLDTHNIFIRIDQSKLEQLGPVISMLLTQLVRHLERRPNGYTTEGRNMRPVLLLSDEFPRIGKVDVIINALATLRIKKVTIAMFLQSLSQLDLLYGVHQRKIIMDNCPYLAVLSVNDVDTQKYISQRIGDRKVQQVSQTLSNNEVKLKSSNTYSYQYEPVVRPHKLSNPKDIKLITPEGHYNVKKNPYYENEKQCMIPRTISFVKKVAIVIRSLFKRIRRGFRGI